MSDENADVAGIEDVTNPAIDPETLDAYLAENPPPTGDTPGPWEAAKKVQYYGDMVHTDEEQICAGPLGVYHDPERVQANGCLIAAAPELLAVARIALSAIEMGDMLNGAPGRVRPVKALLRAAIARAEGR